MVLSISEHKVIFQPDGKRVKVKDGQTILEVAISSGVDLVSICGGAGTCGKCKIIVEKGAPVNAFSKVELKLLSKEEINQGIRLGCQTVIHGDITVKIPEYSRTGKQRLQIEGIDTPIKLDPSVRKFYIEINKPTLKDPKPDVDRIKEELYTKFKLSNLNINFNLIKNVSNIVRESDWKVTIVIWDNEIITIEPNDTTKRLFGYAVDIGTTKLAGYLIDLNTGKVISAGSLMNPQIPYGEDIISRMNYPDQDKLQAAIIEGINTILEDLKEKTGVKSEEIYEMTAVGNTAMHHLFFKLNTKFLGYAPYPPVVRESIIIDVDKIGININPYGKIYFLPIIAGYVGADNVAVILSTEIYKSDKICLALDIGTNTEVVLGNKEKILSCSCASGPAFEGAQIKFGMRAASGAIERVKIDPESLKLTYKTIDDEPPKGICGSAMVDLLAEMLKSGIIDVTGKFNKKIKDPNIRVVDENQ
ncbi:MAG: ASKHA domain-containing protein, partial [Promethearchaeota archaeon]